MAAPRPAPASTEDVRRHNLGGLLRIVHERGQATRSELTAATGLNRSTIKALTEDLAAQGLVQEDRRAGRAATGRPSITVRPRSEHVYALALDIGVQHLTAVRVGLGGVVLDSRRVPQTPADFAVEHTVARLARLAAEIEAAAVPGATCIGIGVGVCGVVSPGEGTVRFAPNLGWVDVPLRDLLAATLATALPIVLGNDGDVGAVAEHLRGAGRGCADMVFVTGEVGIGGGLILGGRLVGGTGGFGGEVGHMGLDQRGRLCRCGRRGCWETEIGEAAVLTTVEAPPGTTLEQVLAAHVAGEDWVEPGLLRVAQAVGYGVANLVNVFNPELIVFGGAIGQVVAALGPLVDEAAAQALAAPRQQARLAVTALGDDATALGAAELAFAPLLADPSRTLLALTARPAGAAGLAAPPAGAPGLVPA